MKIKNERLKIEQAMDRGCREVLQSLFLRAKLKKYLEFPKLPCQYTSYREPDNKIYKDEIGMVDTKDDRNLRGNTRDKQQW